VHERERSVTRLVILATRSACCALACLMLLAGCTRQPPVVGVTPLKAANPEALKQRLLAESPDVAVFRLRGPFAVVPRKDMEIRVSPNSVVGVDLYLCAKAEKAPLVILVHGHGNSKEDHAFQAMHLASWGMHAMAIEMSNHGPWIAHGKDLVSLVRMLRESPQSIDRRIDPETIVLAGHSFGGTAVAAALGEGVPAIGGILLDPAGIGRQLPGLLRRIKAPIMVIGADEDIWPARNRDYFYRFIPAGIGEVSIRDAVHEDAQYPTERTRHAFEDGPLHTEAAQIAFVSALTASAFSITATGSTDYAWTSFGGAIDKGVFFNARRK